MNPIKLKIKNFFSHENSELDFDFKSCLLIGNTEGDYTKSNGSGKSAIFESMLWALFNKSRAPKMDDLVRWGEMTAEVSIEFESDGDHYNVTRVKNKKNSSSSVTLEKNIDGIWKDISGSTSSLTNKMIEETLKLDYKTFLNTTYFRQSDASEFAEAKPFKRKEILKSIVDIHKWDEWEDKAKLEIKNLKSDVKVLGAQAEELSSLEEKVKAESKRMSDFSVSLDKINESIDMEEQSYESFLTEVLIMRRDSNSNSIEESKKVVSDEKNNKNTFLGSIRNLTSRRKRVHLNVEKCDASIDSSREKIERSSFSDFDEGEIKVIRGKSSDLKAQKMLLEKSMKALTGRAVREGVCDSCGLEVTKESAGRILFENSEKLKNMSEELDNIISNMKEKLSELKTMEESKRLSDVCQKEKEKIIFLIDKRASFESELSRVDLEMSNLQKKLSVSLRKLSVHEEKLIAFKDSDMSMAEKKLELKKDQLSSLRLDSLELKKSIGVCEANTERYSERISKLSESKKEMIEKQKEIEDFQMLKNIFGKGGIQTILLENVIKNHQHIANEVLKDICNEPIQIYLDTQKDSSDGSRTLETLDLKIRKDGNVLGYELLSGGEKFRISLALALGLRELAARFGGANLNLIMLDEVNSPLDRYGVETLFVNVIEKISNRYKTMVITHDETLKEKFDTVIDVTKVNGVSSINYNSSN